MEPHLTSDSLDVIGVDAGDIITLSITVHHLPNPDLSAFQLHLSIFYPNTRVAFLGAKLTLATSSNSTVVGTSNGTVSFAVTELAPQDEALVTMTFMLLDDVRSGEVIDFPRILQWCSQSELFQGGRNYSMTGIQKVQLSFLLCCVLCDTFLHR